MALFSAVGAFFALTYFIYGTLSNQQVVASSAPIGGVEIEKLDVGSVSSVETGVELTREPFSVKSLVRVLFENGLNEHEVNTMVEIARLESTYNERAYSSLFEASGLFQIIPNTWTGYGCTGDVFYWLDNTVCAVRIYRGAHNGFHQWEAYAIKIAN